MPGEVHDSTVLFDQEAGPWSADLVMQLGEKPFGETPSGWIFCGEVDLKDKKVSIQDGMIKRE